MDKKKEQIKKLLYLNKRLTERIYNAIEEEILRDRFDAKKFMESFQYVIDEEMNRIIK